MDRTMLLVFPKNETDMKLAYMPSSAIKLVFSFSPVNLALHFEERSGLKADTI